MNIAYRMCHVPVLIVALLVGGIAHGQATVAGNWMGTLRVPGMELRIVFKIETDEDGNHTATMDSIDQGVLGLPVSAVTVENHRVTLEVKSINGAYTGTLSEDGRGIKGSWSQAGASLPLDLERTEDVPVLNRPQEPKPPFPYTTQDVAYDNPEADGVRLGGTLALPQGPGPHPAVLFITGSGPQDRDESLLGHKPFLVISDHLVRQGIATLRVDDRGVGASTGAFEAATMFDFAGDVRAGIDFLKTREEIDPLRIGLLGHSEGGLVAPLVAADSTDVAFIVLLSGPAVPGDEVLRLQTERVQRAMGMPESIIDRARETNGKIFALVREEPDPERLEVAVRAVIDGLTPAEKQAINIDAQVAMIKSPWLRAFLTYDPRTALRRVSCPVLALFAENDLQVPPDQSLPELERALDEGQNPDATVIELPGLNHLYQPSTTGSPAEYAKIEQTIAPVALETIATWINERFGR